MKMITQTLFSGAAILVFALTANTIGQAQGSIRVEGVVIKGSGHWLMEEATSQFIPQLVAFVNK